MYFLDTRDTNRALPEWSGNWDDNAINGGMQ